MGKLFKKMKARITTVKAGSKPLTGIAAGDQGSNQPRPGGNRRPGRRGADTPLGPGAQRM